MFSAITKFELGFWFRGWMVFVFTLIIATLFWGATSSENVRIGGAIENTNRNAPLVIETFYVAASTLTLLMTAAFASSAATRDFTAQTDQILFATPLRKLPYLLGRYTGSTLAALFPMLGVSIGIYIASFMPWNEPERWSKLGPQRSGSFQGMKEAM